MTGIEHYSPPAWIKSTVGYVLADTRELISD